MQLRRGQQIPIDQCCVPATDGYLPPELSSGQRHDESRGTFSDCWSSSIFGNVTDTMEDAFLTPTKQ